MSIFKDYEQERRDKVFAETVEKVELILKHLDLRYVPQEQKEATLEKGWGYGLFSVFSPQDFVLSAGPAPKKKGRPRKKKRGRPRKETV